MAPKVHSNLPVRPEHPKKAPQLPPPTRKVNYIPFASLKALISIYTSQHLNHPTDRFTAQDLLDLEDHWDLLISDCFQEIFEKHLKCSTCPQIHYNKGVEETLEGVRTAMERKPVLEITEDDVEDWEWELAGLVILYWGELKDEGGCPATRPKPGTLVDGKLVLEEWEERVRVEWMERMFGERWWEHPIVTGKNDEDEGILAREESNSDGDKVVMETTYGEIIGWVAEPKVMVDRGDVVEEEEEEEEEGGIAMRTLRELGMEDYEHKGKEIDYGKTADFERQSIEARKARLMREVGMEGVEPTSRKHVDLMDYDDDDDEEDGGVALHWD